MPIQLERVDGGYCRRGFVITRARLDGRPAWRVRDVEGLSKTDFTVKTLADVRRWFAWLEGDAR